MLPSGPVIGLSASPVTCQPGRALEPVANAVADLLMQRGIAHHALLAHIGLADLELGFDQRDQARAGRGQPHRGGQHHLLGR